VHQVRSARTVLPEERALVNPARQAGATCHIDVRADAECLLPGAPVAARGSLLLKFPSLMNQQVSSAW
jgi:hypothetical protein